MLKTAYFVVAQSITSLLFVKLNPTAPSNESHKKVICATTVREQTLSVSSYFHQHLPRVCLRLDGQSHLSQMQFGHFIESPFLNHAVMYFFSYIFILTLQPFQSSLWIKCVESETGSTLKHCCCNIISYQKIKSVDK